MVVWVCELCVLVVVWFCEVLEWLCGSVSGCVGLSVGVKVVVWVCEVGVLVFVWVCVGVFMCVCELVC